MSALTTRLAKLELSRLGRYRYTPEDCPGPPTALVDDGDPLPEDAPPCPLCGVPHVLVVHVEIVEANPSPRGE